ncbi:MAG: hypothetical protein AABX99_03205 [Nanoarchaeota archaeon]
MKLLKITKKGINEQKREIQKSKKSKTFKSKSDKIFNEMVKTNPELWKIIGPTLDSKKTQDYKKGYISGITTFYDLLKRESKKS